MEIGRQSWQSSSINLCNRNKKITMAGDKMPSSTNQTFVTKLTIFMVLHQDVDCVSVVFLEEVLHQTANLDIVLG